MAITRVDMQLFLERAQRDMHEALRVGNHKLAQLIHDQAHAEFNKYSRDHYAHIAQAPMQVVSTDGTSQAAFENMLAAQQRVWQQNDYERAWKHEQADWQRTAPLGNKLDGPFRTPIKPDLVGVPLYKGALLPDDWNGAKITGYRLQAEGTYWVLVFTSKWAPESADVTVYLPGAMGKVEMDEMALSFIAMLNQRRLLS